MCQSKVAWRNFIIVKSKPEREIKKRFPRKKYYIFMLQKVSSILKQRPKSDQFIYLAPKEHSCACVKRPRENKFLYQPQKIIFKICARN